MNASANADAKPRQAWGMKLTRVVPSEKLRIRFRRLNITNTYMRTSPTCFTRRAASFLTAIALLATIASSRALTFSPVFTVDPNTPPSVQDQQRQATIQALNNLATYFQPSNITLRVEFTFKNLGNTGTLGQAGPSGFQQINGIYYAQALYNFITKTDVSGTTTTLSVEMNTNSSVKWNYTNTTPPAGEYSWQDVIMHEVGHSMGFFDTLEKNGAYNNPGPSIFETLSTLGVGGPALSTLDMSARANAIVSNNVYWNGQFGIAANNNTPIKLYTPNPYESGSTYSHIDPSQTNAGGIYFPSLADGVYFPGPTAQELAIFRDVGWATTGAATPTPAPSPSPTASPTATPSATPADIQLVNISTRVVIGSSDQVGIGGFIVRGNLPKKVLIRAIGPSLTNRGVTGALSDPFLELRDEKGALITANDNWRATQETEIAATGAAPGNDAEAAIIATLDAGKSYTAIVKGSGGATGIGLIEVFDLAINSGSDLANISTRGNVLTGDNIMIGGFIVQGANPQTVVVRGIGPSLTAAGVQGALADPTLEIRDAAGALLFANDNWKDDANQATALQQAGIAPTRDEESAIIVKVPAGSYTAQLRGKNGTGVGLVEVYNLKPSAPTQGRAMRVFRMKNPPGGRLGDPSPLALP